MDYIRELNAFRNLATINPLPTGQVALWHMLMSINNMTGWKEWFSVPNQTLQTVTGLSRQGLAKARQGLIQCGLLQYRPGRSNKAGYYRMVSLLSECKKVGTGVGTAVVTAAALQESHEESQRLSQQERSGRHSSGTLLDRDRDETNTPLISPPALAGKKRRAKPPAKTQYAEFVSLTNDEHSSLVAKLGSEQRVQRCIEILDNYKGASGKKYASDYRAILNWVIARLEEEERGVRSRGAGCPGPDPEGEYRALIRR